MRIVFYNLVQVSERIRTSHQEFFYEFCLIHQIIIWPQNECNLTLEIKAQTILNFHESNKPEPSQTMY